MEAVPPPSLTAAQQFLAALFGTIVTGGILVVLASNWSFLVLYPIGLLVGFSSPLIQTYWRVSALVGVVMLIGVTSMLLSDNEDGLGEQGDASKQGDAGEQGDADEQVRVSEMSGGQEVPNQDTDTQLPPPSLLPPLPPPSAKKGEDTPEKPVQIVLPGIPFAFNDRTIQPEHLTKLNEAIRILNDNPHIAVLISGYSDAVGPEWSNLKLSRDRAEAVREYLVEHGIAAERLRVVGRGEIDPLAPNIKDDGLDNPEGRAVNRRVELLVE